MKAPDYISPFVAYRSWQWDMSVAADSRCLQSLNGAPWTPKIAMKAECAAIDPISSAFTRWRPSHPASVPHSSCTCGIYAAKNWQHLIDIGYVDLTCIHGEVNLWGKIIEHKLGYRAQYAYPKHFVIWPGMLSTNIKEAEKFLKQLVEFDVDIYVSTDNKTPTNLKKLPLWVKDYGYSQQGIDFILRRMERFRNNDPQLEIGDRIAVKNIGIGIVQQFINYSGQDSIIINCSGFTLRIPEKKISYNNQNQRWETETAITCGRAMILPLALNTPIIRYLVTALDGL